MLLLLVQVHLVQAVPKILMLAFYYWIKQHFRVINHAVVAFHQKS
jgi:hypothetical protein